MAPPIIKLFGRIPDPSVAEARGRAPVGTRPVHMGVPQDSQNVLSFF